MFPVFPHSTYCMSNINVFKKYRRLGIALKLKWANILLGRTSVSATQYTLYHLRDTGKRIMATFNIVVYRIFFFSSERFLPGFSMQMVYWNDLNVVLHPDSRVCLTGLYRL